MTGPVHLDRRKSLRDLFSNPNDQGLQTAITFNINIYMNCSPSHPLNRMVHQMNTKPVILNIFNDYQ